MKKAKILFLGLMTLALLTSCEKKGGIPAVDKEPMVKVVKSQLIDMADFPEEGCGLQTFDLIAGQHIYAGSVQAIISLDATTLFVKYEAFGDCEFTEAHLFVGNSVAVIPTGNTGNPKIGHFPYFWEEMGPETVVTFSIPVEDLDLGEDDCFKIAAHAVAICGGVEETAWARGSDLVFALKSYLSQTEEDERMITANRPIEEGEDWLDVLGYYPLAEALAAPIILVSHLDGETPMGTAEVVELTDGSHQLEIRAYDDGVIYKTWLYIGPASAFTTDIPGYWTEFAEVWNHPANPHVIPISVSDALGGTEFDGSRWGWFVEYCVPGCLP